MDSDLQWIYQKLLIYNDDEKITYKINYIYYLYAHFLIDTYFLFIVFINFLVTFLKVIIYI